MSKIVAISKYGFKVDSLRNDWEKVDKTLLKRDVFNMLEKGLEIEIKERNTKGFILDFKILDSKARKLEEEQTSSPLINMDNKSSFSSPSPDIKACDKERQILKGQCLNIAFKDIDVTDSNGRSVGIRNAQKLFVELEEANFYRW